MTRSTVSTIGVLLALGASALAGCSGSRAAGPYATLGEAARNPLEAQRLTAEAADLIHTKPQKAEELLRLALTADLYHGPAHNNLGVIYLKQGKLYEAASEFEWARKLMPGHPDPRTNLALTLEKAGRTDEAIRSYLAALESVPEDLAAAQGLIRLQLRSGKTDARTRERLEMIAFRGDPAWRDWARARLAATSGEE